jgi:hypothetical protein
MKYRFIFALTAFSAVGALFTACSSSSSSGGGVTTLAGIPAITGPVTTSSSVLKYPKDLSKALMPVLGAVTSLISSGGKTQSSRTFGMKASDWSSNTWTNKSGPLCEMGQQVSELFRNAANPDKILCYIAAMESTGLFTGDNYDGNWKFYNVTGAPSRSSLKVKFRIQKTAGAISDFVMYTAPAARTGSQRPVCSNSEYIHADLSNGANITSVHLENNGGDIFKGRVVATGNLDSTGAWTSKTITTNNSGAWGSDTNGNYSVLNQYSDLVTLSGSMDSIFSGQPNSNKMYAQMALVDASPYVDLQYGDGAVKMWADWPGGLTPDIDQVRGWDMSGDKISASTSAYYNDVTAASYPALKSYAAVESDATLLAGETWDCSADSGSSFIDVDMTAAYNGILACEAQYGGAGGGNWVQCWSNGSLYSDGSR